jgi:late competence protein required for DNA uptake (superfamily II DNA/RNA helicase)
MVPSFTRFRRPYRTLALADNVHAFPYHDNSIVVSTAKEAEANQITNSSISMQWILHRLKFLNIGFDLPMLLTNN